METKFFKHIVPLVVDFRELFVNIYLHINAYLFIA